MMNKMVLKSVVLTLAVVLAVPESMARRLGGGRTIGRQSQTMRQRALPATPMPRPQQPIGVPPVYGNPGALRQTPAPAPIPAPLPPTQPLHRQAATPWGGMLGGALVGLGLGSLMSSGNRDANAPAQNLNSGSAGQNGSANGGDGINNPGTAAAQAQTQQSGFGSLIVPAILALLAFFLFRKIRAKNMRKQAGIGL